jgi:hypothetical protein
MSAFSNLTDVVLFLCDLHLLNWFGPLFARSLESWPTSLRFHTIMISSIGLICPSLAFWPTSLILSMIYIFDLFIFTFSPHSDRPALNAISASLRLPFCPSAPTIALTEVDRTCRGPGTLAEGPALKEKCRGPTADSIRLYIRSNRCRELKRFLKSGWGWEHHRR